MCEAANVRRAFDDRLAWRGNLSPTEVLTEALTKALSEVLKEPLTDKEHKLQSRIVMTA